MDTKSWTVPRGAWQGERSGDVADIDRAHWPSAGRCAATRREARRGSPSRRVDCRPCALLIAPLPCQPTQPIGPLPADPHWPTLKRATAGRSSDRQTKQNHAAAAVRSALAMTTPPLQPPRNMHGPHHHSGSRGDSGADRGAEVAAAAAAAASSSPLVALDIDAEDGSFLPPPNAVPQRRLSRSDPNWTGPHEQRPRQRSLSRSSWHADEALAASIAASAVSASPPAVSGVVAFLRQQWSALTGGSASTHMYAPVELEERGLSARSRSASVSGASLYPRRGLVAALLLTICLLLALDRWVIRPPYGLISLHGLIQGGARWQQGSGGNPPPKCGWDYEGGWKIGTCPRHPSCAVQLRAVRRWLIGMRIVCALT